MKTPEQRADMLAEIADLSDELERLGQQALTNIQFVVKHLGHESPIVREGAIYGLASILSARDALETGSATLYSLAAHDPSPAVRECASEALQ